MRCIRNKRRHRGDPSDAGLEASELQGLGKSRSGLGSSRPSCVVCKREGLTANIFCCCGKEIEQDKRNGKISSRPLSRCRGFWWNKKTDRFKISVTLDDDGIFCVFVALAKKDHFQLINISGNGFSALWSSVQRLSFHLSLST